jgi:predicted PurR-regulated permease PerM
VESAAEALGPSGSRPNCTSSTTHAGALRRISRLSVIHLVWYEANMAEAESSSGGRDTSRRGVDVSISIRTILLIAGAVAIGWALASVANVLLMIFVSVFSVAVLLPVVTAMERRSGRSRRLCSLVLVLGIVIVLGAFALVLVQAMSGALRGLSDDLPQIVDKVRHSDLGHFINSGSGSLDTLRKHASDITGAVGKVSAGAAHIGVSALGAVTLALSVIFLTLFGLIDEPRWRDWIGSLLYRDKRERFLRVTDRIIHTTSRYMLGNLAISVICGTVYGVTAVILGLPYPLALAVIAAILDLIPNIGATLAGIIIGIVALSVSLGALIAFAIVIVVYQAIENYILQPTIIGKAAQVSGFTVLVSVLAFGALFGLIGAIIGVPIAAALQIVAEELTGARRARIAAADAAEQQQSA